MPAWLDVQRDFRASVTGADQPIAAHVRAARGAAGNRISIYRNTVQQSLIDILAAAYPAVQRIVGVRFFHAIAREYVISQLPNVPQLSLYGGGFATFLQHHPRLADIPYAADVARLEWARGESYFAADAPALNPVQLQATAPERLGDVRFTVHPATRAVRSRFPIHRIWSVNQPDVVDVPAIDMSVAECVLFTRPAFQVAVHSIGVGECVFIEALADGRTLQHAVEAALSIDPAFDLQISLQRHLVEGVFTAITLPET